MGTIRKRQCRVLKALLAAGTGMRADGLARACRLPVNDVWRIIRTLESRGLVQQGADGLAFVPPTAVERAEWILRGCLDTDVRGTVRERIVRILTESGPMLPGALMRAVGASSPAFYRALAALEADGAVVRERADNGRGIVRIPEDTRDAQVETGSVGKGSRPRRGLVRLVRAVVSSA